MINAFTLRIIIWLASAWLVIWLTSALLTATISILLFAIVVGTALCCIYALFPPQFRIGAIEQWLDPNWRPLGLPSGNPNSTPPIPSNPNSTPTTVTPPPFVEPQLDFSRISARTASKVPDRETLKRRLQAKVIGQSNAIDVLVKMTLSQIAMVKGNKPLVIFLPGPTGSGKTEISKALAEALSTKLVRFDMGEYAESFKASNLFGSPKGYVGATDGGALPNALRTGKRTCVILFDEVEKAHPSLWRQLLAFFDEGRVSDTLGTVTAPKDTICLLTSNLEADKIATDPDLAKDIIKECGYFPPEFLGRIDKVIPLLRLSKEDTAKLIVAIAKSLADRYSISLAIEQEALDELVAATSEDAMKYGGRGIKEKIRDLLVDNLMDLQRENIIHARLIFDGDRLLVVSHFLSG